MSLPTIPSWYGERSTPEEQLGKALVTPFIARKVAHPLHESVSVVVKAIKAAAAAATRRALDHDDTRPERPASSIVLAAAPLGASKRNRCQIYPRKKDCKSHTMCHGCNKYIWKGCSCCILIRVGLCDWANSQGKQGQESGEAGTTQGLSSLFAKNMNDMHNTAQNRWLPTPVLHTLLANMMANGLRLRIGAQKSRGGGFSAPYTCDFDIPTGTTRQCYGVLHYQSVLSGYFSMSHWLWR